MKKRVIYSSLRPINEDTWSQPGIITQGDDWFVSESDYLFLAVAR